MDRGLGKKHLKEFLEVMGLSEEMMPLLPLLRSRTHMMNPWVRVLPGVFRGLHLTPGLRVLDLPCGEGGVSVPLARRYGAHVRGYDLFPAFVSHANQLARKTGVERLCRFHVGGIRDVVEDVVRLRARYDLLLWIAAPNVFGNPRSTIEALRRCVKRGGLIVIADAYRLRTTGARAHDDHTTLAGASLAYSSLGDDLMRVLDHRGRLWREDYRRERSEIERAMHHVTKSDDLGVLRRHYRRLAGEERAAIRTLGTAIWIIRRASP